MLSVLVLAPIMDNVVTSQSKALDEEKLVLFRDVATGGAMTQKGSGKMWLMTGGPHSVGLAFEVFPRCGRLRLSFSVFFFTDVH